MSDKQEEDDSVTDEANVAINAAFQRKLYTLKIPEDIKPFRNYVFPRFDAQYVYWLLRDGREAYEGQGDILFHGFCAWVISPQDDRFIRSAMIKAGATVIQNMEQRVFDLNLPNLTELILSRYAMSDILYSDFYKTVGGLRGIIKNYSKNIFKDHESDLRRDIERAIRIFDIIRVHGEHCSDSTSFRKVSLSGLIKLHRAGSAFKMESANTLKNAWRQHEKSIAFIAATRGLIRLKSKSTFLNELIKGRINYRIDKQIIEKWFNRAAYIDGHVISPLRSEPLFLSRPPKLRAATEGETIAKRQLTPKQMEAVLAEFGLREAKKDGL